MEIINILGIDTSNYTTSISLLQLDTKTKEEVLLKDLRIKLKVKEGAIGLRQSEAHFQHSQNLPILIEKLRGEQIDCISVSTTPRRLEGSYMPVFTAGAGYGKALAAALDVDVNEFSHQEGHIGGAFEVKKLEKNNELIFMHLSGGTSEIIKSKNICKDTEIIGGTLDISIGQLLDRVAGKMSIPFPGGEEIDRMALEHYNSIINSQNKDTIKLVKTKDYNPLSLIKLKKLEFNLSGLETKAGRLVEEKVYSFEEISYFIMERVSKLIVDILKYIDESLSECTVCIGGGVANSKFLKEYLYKNNEFKNIDLVFSQYADDNAVGIARLGGVFYGR